MIDAAGDVSKGFAFEIKRSHSFDSTTDHPSKRIPLQWVDAKHFDEKAMFNDRKFIVDNEPACGFEASVRKVKVPEKSLNSIDDAVSPQFEFLRSRHVKPIVHIISNYDELRLLEYLC